MPSKPPTFNAKFQIMDSQFLHMSVHLITHESFLCPCLQGYNHISKLRETIVCWLITKDMIKNTEKYSNEEDTLGYSLESPQRTIHQHPKQGCGLQHRNWGLHTLLGFWWMICTAATFDLVVSHWWLSYYIQTFSFARRLEEKYESSSSLNTCLFTLKPTPSPETDTFRKSQLPIVSVVYKILYTLEIIAYQKKRVKSKCIQ